MPDTDRCDLTEILPQPGAVRLLLARRLREVEVLRRLLRLAEFACVELRDRPAQGQKRDGAERIGPEGTA